MIIYKNEEEKEEDVYISIGADILYNEVALRDYEKEELNAREGIAFHNHSKELCNNTRNRMGGYGCFVVGARRPGRRKRKIGRSDCQNKVEQG